MIDSNIGSKAERLASLDCDSLRISSEEATLITPEIC